MNDYNPYAAPQEGASSKPICGKCGNPSSLRQVAERSFFLCDKCWMELGETLAEQYDNVICGRCKKQIYANQAKPSKTRGYLRLCYDCQRDEAEDIEQRPLLTRAKHDPSAKSTVVLWMGIFGFILLMLVAMMIGGG